MINIEYSSSEIRSNFIPCFKKIYKSLTLTKILYTN